MNLSHSITIRNALPSDHKTVLSVIPEWWGGRDLRSSLPKLFFLHFGNSSFIAEKNGILFGFLVGFLSQDHPEEGYIHFAGVRPGFRNQGLGKTLYRHFYTHCLTHSRTIVRSCTAPENRLSIGFHRRMGFVPEPGDIMEDGIPVTLGYLRENDRKVVFKKMLAEKYDNAPE